MLPAMKLNHQVVIREIEVKISSTLDRYNLILRLEVDAVFLKMHTHLPLSLRLGA